MLQDVRAHQEARLYYPGSKVLATAGADEGTGGALEGHTPAYSATVLAVQDVTPQQIYDWYQAQLAQRGWHEDHKDGLVAFGDTRDTREAFDVELTSVPAI